MTNQPETMHNFDRSLSLSLLLAEDAPACDVKVAVACACRQSAHVPALKSPAEHAGLFPVSLSLYYLVAIV